MNSKIQRLLAATIIFCCNPLLCCVSVAQQIRVEEQLSEAGIVRMVKSGTVSIITDDARVVTCKIQNKNQEAISIGGKPIRSPAEISVSGEFPAKLLEKGMIVHFKARARENGKTAGEIELVKVSGDASTLKVEFAKQPAGSDFEDCDVVGRVIELSKQKLELQVPKSDFAKRERMTFTLASDAKLQFSSDDLNRVRTNDVVTRMDIFKMNTGELVVKAIDIEMKAEREELTIGFYDKLQQEFSYLNDDPGEPRELRSNNFLLYTDLSDRNAKILLAKLETMHELIGGYYGKRPRIPIECYVVDEMSKWGNHKLDPQGVAKIMEPAGVTLTMRNNRTGDAKSIVYSCDRHGVVQHEAVHAFCSQAFGTAGPVWYAEGMAEIGQYWKPGEQAVNIDPVVINYLTTAEPKKMLDIVAAGQITGDSWQAYSWRWALCHLLANNPNYSRRFKKLGMNMMAGGNETFESAFGSVAQEISFEYDQFVQNFGNGYRVDLCSWDWSVAASNLSSSGRTKATVNSQAGWQPTKLETRAGVSYDYAAVGKWKLSPLEKEVSADGYKSDADDESVRGKLIGLILADHEIKAEFELGARGSFEAPVDGQLYLRCNDDWTEIADNDGELIVHLRRTQNDETPDSETDK